MDFLKSLGIEPKNSGAFIGSSWQKEVSGNRLESFSPIDGELIASISTADDADYEKILKASESAFKEWRTWPAPKRGEIIRKMGEALREHKDALGSLVSYEMGKSKQEGDGEVQEMIDIADFAVGQSRMLYGNTMHSERPNHRMYEQWHPYGVIGIISAFNFPVAVWSWNAFIAAICGNVSVWKPSSKTPLCAIAVHNICAKVLKDNNAPDIFSMFVAESRDVSNKFVEDKRLPLISFTGSTAVGRGVSSKVGERLGASILELGGNNAIIIDESANLDLAIPAAVFGAVGTAGQRCTSTRRLFVHESCYEEVKARLTKAYAQITIGSPLDKNNLMGPLIDEAAVKQFSAAVKEAVDAGGEVLFGGQAIKQPGFYVEPTLICNVENTWPIVQEETFAPILYLMKVQSLDEAIALQNGVAQGLSSSLFSNSLQASETFLSAMGSDCGIANINIGTSGAEIGGAFGGEKDTGGGRESGSDSWKAYMRRQTNTINWGRDLPLAQGIEFNL
jgi:aldehyde dehydrogenase (NAD+)